MPTSSAAPKPLPRTSFQYGNALQTAHTPAEYLSERATTMPTKKSQHKEIPWTSRGKSILSQKSDAAYVSILSLREGKIQQSKYASSSCSSSVNINTVMDVGTCEYTTYHRNSSPMPTTTFIASTDANNPIDKVSTQSNNATINLRTSTSESASESTSESQPPNQPPIEASCYILTITYL